jgi:hypothetical protein
LKVMIHSSCAERQVIYRLRCTEAAFGQ